MYLFMAMDDNKLVTVVRPGDQASTGFHDSGGGGGGGGGERIGLRVVVSLGFF